MSRAALAAALLLLLTACAIRPALRTELDAGRPARVELAATPFFPQQAFHCGPAALATVLVASGVPVTPDALAPQVYLPARRGSLQAELLAAARRHGRLAYEFDATPANLLAELGAGHPVLVLQNLGTRRWPRWHYAVLVGYDAGADRAILRSGRRERLAPRWSRFVATLDRADRWGLVTLEPGRLPAAGEARRYVAAAAGLEQAGSPGLALRAYAAGLARWPDEALLWLGHGNAAHAAGDVAAALDSYRRAAALAPGNAAARHNHAAALLESGCAAAARAELDEARTRLAEGPLSAALAALAERAEGAVATEDPPHCARGPAAPDPGIIPR